MLKEEIPNTFFNGKWNEIELIGEGSYGKVYKAKKEEFGIVSYAAIKQIKIPYSKSEVNTLRTEGMSEIDIGKYYEASVKNLLKEIEFMSNFEDSENIVSVNDYEIIKKPKEIGWTLNIRMELLTNLDDYVRENGLTDKETLKMAIDIASALEDCEEKNVVHRDIKPENIFVNGKGVYKVGDFGTARQIEKSISNLSRNGTEIYMAPELYKNERANRTVDIYSLGIMLYRYFNYNRLPFMPDYPEPITVKTRADALEKRINGEKMPPPRNASREIAEIILKACNYYSKERYQNAKELKKDLIREYENIKIPKDISIKNEKVSTNIEDENDEKERRKREEEEVKRREEERKREEEEARKREEDRKREEEGARKRAEERKREEEARKREENRKREEEERKRKEQEKRKREEERKRRKERKKEGEEPKENEKKEKIKKVFRTLGFVILVLDVVLQGFTGFLIGIGGFISTCFLVDAVVGSYNIIKEEKRILMKLIKIVGILFGILEMLTLIAVPIIMII